jgi:hypothetical protein
MVAVTVSPTLFLLERISAVVDAVNRVPAARLAEVAAGAVLEDGLGGVGALVVGAAARVDGVVGRAAGRLGRVGVLAAGAGAALAVAVSLGRSFSSAVVSTGASCRSRLRLSAVAVLFLSPRPQAVIAARVSAAIIVFDIATS